MICSMMHLLTLSWHCDLSNECNTTKQMILKFGRNLSMLLNLLAMTPNQLLGLLRGHCHFLGIPQIFLTGPDTVLLQYDSVPG